MHALFVNGLGKKLAQDAAIAGVGIGAPVMAGVGAIQDYLAVIIGGLMVALLVLRVYNEWRAAKRQDMKDDQYREPPDQ